MRTFRFTHIAVIAVIALSSAGCQAWIPRQPAPAPGPAPTPTLAPPTLAPTPTPTATATPTPTPTPRPLPTATPTRPPVPAADDTPGVRQALLRLHNQVRRGYDLPLYAISPALEQAAQKQAEYLAGLPLDTLNALGDAAHLGPDGSPPDVRMRAAGYSLAASAENWGLFARWQDAFVSWLNDERRRQAIISPEYREIGIGIARHSASGNYVFVVDYAAPR
ncbi:MAG: CAP domain-containing protein [Anaerolineae bacterium]|nr:CAP domain-containing protein [Candidatus Roseilinea sp.]MDW8448982.1 CAP domain-containing protein [Anaerolineae bacterium]